MDPRSAGGVGRNTAGQQSADRAAADRNSRAGPSLSRDQVTAMVTGRPIAQPATPTGPAPTFGHNQGISGPRPGTADRWGTTIGQNPTIQADQTAYNAAANALQNRSLGQLIGDRLLGMVPGFHTVEPDWQHPETYQGGAYHNGWSPLSAALGVAGSAAPVPGAGLAGSLLGQAATDAMGLPDYNFGSGTWHNTAPSPIAQAFGGKIEGQSSPSSVPGAQFGPGSAQGGMPGGIQSPGPGGPSPGMPGSPAQPPQQGAPPAQGTPFPNYAQMMAQNYPVYGGYSVPLPQYQYLTGGYGK